MPPIREQPAVNLAVRHTGHPLHCEDESLKTIFLGRFLEALNVTKDAIVADVEKTVQDLQNRRKRNLVEILKACGPTKGFKTFQGSAISTSNLNAISRELQYWMYWCSRPDRAEGRMSEEVRLCLQDTAESTTFRCTGAGPRGSNLPVAERQSEQEEKTRTWLRKRNQGTLDETRIYGFSRQKGRNTRPSGENMLLFATAVRSVIQDQRITVWPERRDFVSAKGAITDLGEAFLRAFDEHANTSTDHATDAAREIAQWWRKVDAKGSEPAPTVRLSRLKDRLAGEMDKHLLPWWRSYAHARGRAAGIPTEPGGPWDATAVQHLASLIQDRTWALALHVWMDVLKMTHAGEHSWCQDFQCIQEGCGACVLFPQPDLEYGNYNRPASVIPPPTAEAMGEPVAGLQKALSLPRDANPAMAPLATASAWSQAIRCLPGQFTCLATPMLGIMLQCLVDGTQKSVPATAQDCARLLEAFQEASTSEGPYN